MNKQEEQYVWFYALSVLIILLASVYPIYMAVKTIAAYYKAGFVLSKEYPKYIIPYAPICIGLVLTVILMPVIYRYLKKWALTGASILALAVFLLLEIALEKIPVLVGYTIDKLSLETWQLSLCMITPEVMKAMQPVFAESNPTFKVHFYLISIIIILAVINVVYGFSKMFKEKDFSKKKPLTAQLISSAIFVGLCIYACFTAFYRDGSINVSPLTATLMSIFFVIFGITFGTYMGSIFFGKNKLLSVIIPTITAMLTTFAMYIGELLLMDGKLYILGKGILFKSIGNIPFSVFDFLVVIMAGAATYAIMALINKNKAGDRI